MNAIEILSSQSWVERLGWTLIHFLWQGVLISAVYAAARRWMLNSAGPNARYVLACVALASMVVAPMVTWSFLRAPDAVGVASGLSAHAAVDTAHAATSPPVALFESGAQSTQFLPWVVTLWVAGVTVLWVRLIASWVLAARLRSRMVRPAPSEWQQTLDRLKARLGVSRPVRLLISALAQTPAVVGYLRPVVLVPVGALSGLPSAQVEALLIHELAHIRRHDYLVNILQSLAEALLFYHPAIWWVSWHIRSERELCCDDAAVAFTGDAFTYALALAELESARPAHIHAALAANNGSLKNRIARLLGQPRPASRKLPGIGALASAILLVAAAFGAFAQSAGSPQFAAASVKRGLLATVEVPITVRMQPGGRLTTKNAPLLLLIQRAYGVQPYQVVGGPAWIKSDGFDIEAKPETNTSQKQMWLMLQTLLADRFKLKLHRETRELPVYALIVAKGGPKLPRPKASPCSESMPSLEGPRPQRLAPPCGPGVVKSGTGLTMEGLNLTMAKFTGFLGSIIGRAVIDKTGFTGKFDLHLEFAFDDVLAGIPQPLRPNDFDRAPDPLARPSIMTAVQEQLGLKLESTKGPVEVLVIDHAGRPAEN